MKSTLSEYDRRRISDIAMQIETLGAQMISLNVEYTKLRQTAQETIEEHDADPERVNALIDKWNTVYDEIQEDRTRVSTLKDEVREIGEGILEKTEETSKTVLNAVNELIQETVDDGKEGEELTEEMEEINQAGLFYRLEKEIENMINVQLELEQNGRGKDILLDTANKAHQKADCVIEEQNEANRKDAMVRSLHKQEYLLSQINGAKVLKNELYEEAADKINDLQSQYQKGIETISKNTERESKTNSKEMDVELQDNSTIKKWIAAWRNHIQTLLEKRAEKKEQKNELQERKKKRELSQKFKQTIEHVICNVQETEQFYDNRISELMRDLHRTTEEYQALKNKTAMRTEEKGIDVQETIKRTKSELKRDVMEKENLGLDQEFQKFREKMPENVPIEIVGENGETHTIEFRTGDRSGNDKDNLEFYEDGSYEGENPDPHVPIPDEEHDKESEDLENEAEIYLDGELIKKEDLKKNNGFMRAIRAGGELTRSANGIMRFTSNIFKYPERELQGYRM